MSLVALRTTMLDTRAKTAPARLVLSVGSHAGREAPLQLGYYLIGRHSECQIRPKSRSVSRRHCLLHQNETGIQVLDLGSTSGTRVNDRLIQPMKWAPLRDGDILRCGKVAFRVEMSAGNLRDRAPGAVTDAGEEMGDAFAVGQAWQDLDVAGFLETHDDADRDRRYRAIRSANDVEDEQNDASGVDAQATIVTDVDLDLFSDAFDESKDPQSSAGSEQGDLARAAAVHSASAGRLDPQDAERANPSSVTGKASRLASIASRKRASSWGASRSFSLGSANADRWKLIGMAVVMFAALAVLGYSGYTFYSGPSVRVLESID